MYHGKSEQLGVRWVSIFRVKSEQYNGYRANARCRMGTHIHFHAKSSHKYSFKENKSCATRAPDQNPRDTTSPRRSCIDIIDTWFMVTYIVRYRISLNKRPGVYFLQAPWTPAFKRGQPTFIK